MKHNFLSYDFLPELESKYRDTNSNDMTKIYFDTIYTAIEEVKNKNPSIYNSKIINLHERYFDSRFRYFKIMKLFFRMKIVFKFLKPLAIKLSNFFYCLALKNADMFYKSLSEYSSDNNFYNRICTLEFILWKKRIDDAIST